jgi:hypothetical protein
MRGTQRRLPGLDGRVRHSLFTAPNRGSAAEIYDLHNTGGLHERSVQLIGTRVLGERRGRRDLRAATKGSHRLRAAAVRPLRTSCVLLAASRSKMRDDFARPRCLCRFKLRLAVQKRRCWGVSHHLRCWAYDLNRDDLSTGLHGWLCHCGCRRRGSANEAFV